MTSDKGILHTILLLTVMGLLMSVKGYANPLEAIDTLDKLKERVAEIHKEAQNTAIAVALVEQGEPVWIGAFGMANIKEQQPATAESIFPVGSIAKMIVSLCVMHLVEDGQLELQTPLRQLAPKIWHHNPWEAQEPVRLVHLLEHTTGWPDMSYAEYANHSTQPSDLESALTAYPDSRRSRWVPGTRMAYSNIGPAVAAYIVQKVSGMPFNDYAQKHVLAPLQMTSTGFTPRSTQQAGAYLNGERQKLTYPLYPPSGPLYSSADDMAKLLQFFLRRGQQPAGHPPLISPIMLERMEQPETTLASAKGVTSGYGLGNRSDGFKRFGIDFHGHSGGIPGAMATLYYAPDLNSGYFLALTGNPSGAKPLVDTVRQYLLRNHQAISGNQSPQAENAIALNGTYRPVNPPVDFMAFVPTFFNAVSLTTSTNALHKQSLSGAEESVFISDTDALIDVSSGLPAVAKVTDPLIGDTVQIGSTLFQKVSGVKLWTEMLYWGCVVIFSLAAVLFALFWVPISLWRNTLLKGAARLSWWPTLSSLAFLCAALYPIFYPLDITQITPWSSPATILFSLTLAYGVFATLGVLSLVSLRSINAGKLIKISITALITLHASMAIYLSTYGLIAIRLWTW